ncbi:MAG: hypothetical protein HY395_02355 [Candidatus Doudnabacteria bacterium]|nr:hypothetical protein [Candidatus Doudnabacteria bacterium]
MSYFFLGHKLAWQPIAVSGFLILSLILIPALALGQETQEITDEVKAEVEEQLTTSAEAAKESEVDLKAELELPADYDPVVPDNFIHSVGYGFKKFGRNVQKAAYRAFASDQKEAEMIKKQADKALVEAVKLQSLDPGNEKVVGILDDYQSKLTEVKDKIEKVKSKDAEFAKQLAARVGEDSLFVAPKVLSQIQENLLAVRPEAIPDFVKTKDQALAVAGEAVLKASDSSSEAAETLKIIAFKNFKTPFSGIAAADTLAQAKEHLSEGEYPAFDEAIKASLENVENNLEILEAPDELKAQTLQRYVEQLPGLGLGRMKVIEQFKNQTKLPAVMIEKMTEIKARIAEKLSQRIEAVDDQEIRKAVTESMFEFRDGNLEDLRLINEVKDIIPNEEIRAHIKQKHEEGVSRFIAKFGDDANAKQVTEEFQALTRRVDSGEIVPDANFFKTLEELKTRLSPKQQEFIGNLEQTGKNEMVERMKSDDSFASRFSTANPGDIQYFEKFREELRVEVPDFDAKFREIEKKQSENFERLLDVQDNPDKIREFKQHFDREIPEEIKQRFEDRYEFKFEDQYRKFEERARERNEFFQEKHGKEFPGQQQFPGREKTEPQSESRKSDEDRGGEEKQPRRELRSGEDNRLQPGFREGQGIFEPKSPENILPGENFRQPFSPGGVSQPSIELSPKPSGEVQGALMEYRFDVLETLLSLLGLK